MIWVIPLMFIVLLLKRQRSAEELSFAGREFIKRLEGFSPQPYPDAGGFSIGYGHFLTIEEQSTGRLVVNNRVIFWTNGITREEGEALFQQDVQRYVLAVKEAVQVPLSQNQFDALVSLAYNIGVSAFKTSRLVRNLNSGQDIREDFLQWRFAEGVENAGLIARREQERNLFYG